MYLLWTRCYTLLQWCLPINLLRTWIFYLPFSTVRYFLLSSDLTLFVGWVYFNCVIHFCNSVGKSLNKLSCISLIMYLSKYYLGLNLELLLSLWENSSSWIVNHLSVSSFVGFQPTNTPFFDPSRYTVWYIPPNLIFWVPTDNKTIVGFTMGWTKFWIQYYQQTLLPLALMDTRRQHNTQIALRSLTRDGFYGWPHDSDVCNHGKGCFSPSTTWDLLVVSPQTLIRHYSRPLSQLF